MEAAIEENGAQKVFLGNSHFHKTIISLSLFTRPSFLFHFSQDRHITFTLTRPSYRFHFQEVSLAQGDKTKPHKQGFLSSSTVSSSYQSPSSTSAGKELMELFDRIQRKVKQRNTTFFLKYSRIVFYLFVSHLVHNCQTQVEVQKYNKDVDEEESWELQKRMELAQ